MTDDKAPSIVAHRRLKARVERLEKRIDDLEMNVARDRLRTIEEEDNARLQRKGLGLR